MISPLEIPPTPVAHDYIYAQWSIVHLFYVAEIT